jgi:hypothetical protein
MLLQNEQGAVATAVAAFAFAEVSLSLFMSLLARVATGMSAWQVLLLPSAVKPELVSDEPRCGSSSASSRLDRSKLRVVNTKLQIVPNLDKCAINKKRYWRAEITF